MTNVPPLLFPKDVIEGLSEALSNALQRAYATDRPIPDGETVLPPIPETASTADQMAALWHLIVDGSAHLASPWMSGHMDTAPHPAAAMTQALVAALNNNLLFRELSPLASQVEESLISYFSTQLGLDARWTGTFASGGSIANLTALFAAMGGYEGVDEREKYHLLIPASGHMSLTKSARVMGLPDARIHKIACDGAGSVDLDALTLTLQGLPATTRPVVVSVLGTTIHGSVDDVAAIGTLCRTYNAWHHVDAIYGAALAFSIQHRHFLAGLTEADSIVLGPQKWMYVPRVSAIVLMRDAETFDQRLGVSIPYSLGDQPHRGTWGIQGSRPADAVVLWSALQAMGTAALGQTVDRSIALTKQFHTLLDQSNTLSPAHKPDLNLQIFQAGGSDRTGERLGAVQKRLTNAGRTWMSVSRWQDETYLRAVLLSPSLTEDHPANFISDIEAAL